MTKRDNKSRLAKTGFLLVALIWGVAFAVVKNSLDYIPPVYLMALRFSIAGILLSLVYIKKMIRVDKMTLLHGLAIGFFLFLAYLTQTYGCKYTTAGKNAFLTALYVIFVPFLLWIMFRKRPLIHSFIAAFLSMISIGLISLGSSEGSLNEGDVLTIICALFFALQIIFIARYKNDDPVLLACIQLDTAALLSWLSAPVLDGSIWEISLNPTSVFGLIYLGVLSSLVCFLLQTVCQRYVKASTSALLMSTEAVFGALASYLFLGEFMSSRALWGFVLMFLAIIIALIEPETFDFIYPDKTYRSTYLIDYEKMYDDGVRGIIFDIDNTLVKHDAPADRRAVELFERLHKIGFKMVLLSNNKEGRVKSFQKKVLYCDYIYDAGKPSKKGYIKAMELMGTKRENTVSIGDQLFTDVLGSRGAGVRMFLVDPIDKKEKYYIVLKRILEKPILYFYRIKAGQ
ncbi:MAG: YqeG family HAD IIIA-type phosphatase [Lachnospiraceae bacterium]|nr:YqeG family HAD IIIA-type phosphatase [Lachnospiraceae bacterium]